MGKFQVFVSRLELCFQGFLARLFQAGQVSSRTRIYGRYFGYRRLIRSGKQSTKLLFIFKLLPESPDFELSLLRGCTITPDGQRINVAWCYRQRQIRIDGHIELLTSSEDSSEVQATSLIYQPSHSSSHGVVGSDNPASSGSCGVSQELGSGSDRVQIGAGAFELEAAGGSRGVRAKIAGGGCSRQIKLSSLRRDICPQARRALSKSHHIQQISNALLCGELVRLECGQLPAVLIRRFLGCFLRRPVRKFFGEAARLQIAQRGGVLEHGLLGLGFSKKVTGICAETRRIESKPLNRLAGELSGLGGGSTAGGRIRVQESHLLEQAITGGLAGCPDIGPGHFSGFNCAPAGTDSNIPDIPPARQQVLTRLFGCLCLEFRSFLGGFGLGASREQSADCLANPNCGAYWHVE
jgi:hypothetical protein